MSCKRYESEKMRSYAVVAVVTFQDTEQQLRRVLEIIVVDVVENRFAINLY